MKNVTELNYQTRTMYTEFGFLIRKYFKIAASFYRQEARKLSTAVTGDQQQMFKIITVTVCEFQD